MRYLLTFKPLKNFFFGYDKTFSEDYFAISEYFPQNTQLLGALRLFIAEQNNLMHMHRNGKYSNEPEKLKELIGDASASTFEANTNLGKIKNLSQMFIVNTTLDDAYFPTPFDIEVTKESIKTYTLAHIGDDYFFSDYDVKKNSPQYLAGKQFYSAYLDNETLRRDTLTPFDYDEDEKVGVYRRHTQVGIGLDKKRVIVDEEENGKFYAKVDYILDDGYLFGAVIELEDEIIGDGIIQIGAESSLFELKVQKLETTQLDDHPVIEQLFSQPKEGSKVIALSDIMVPDTKEIASIYSVIPYYRKLRMIKSKTRNSFQGKTDPKRLLPAGSVFYFDKDVVLNKPAQGAYAKMGYNQFITVNK